MNQFRRREIWQVGGEVPRQSIAAPGKGGKTGKGAAGQSMVEAGPWWESNLGWGEDEGENDFYCSGAKFIRMVAAQRHKKKEGKA